MEDTQHVLIDCPAYEEHRGQLRNTCEKEGLDFTTKNLLGLNENIPPKTNYQLRNGVVLFINKTGIINRL